MKIICRLMIFCSTAFALAAFPERPCPTKAEVQQAQKAESVELAYKVSRCAEQRVKLSRVEQAALIEVLSRLEFSEDTALEAGRHYEAKIYGSIIYTLPGGAQVALPLEYISPAKEGSSGCRLLLPTVMYRQFLYLTAYETHKEAVQRGIIEEGREYMAQKAADLEVIQNATAVQLKKMRRNSDGVPEAYTVPLRENEQQEILRILSRLRLSPAEKVVKREPQLPHDPDCIFILTCGDKSVELAFRDIVSSSWLASVPWQECPFVLGDILKRLDMLTSARINGKNAVRRR